MSFFQPSGSPNAALTSSQTLTFVLTGACADFRPVHHVPIPSAILRFLGAKEVQGTLLALQFVRADVGRGHPSRRTLQLQSELCKCHYAMGMFMTAILQLNRHPPRPPAQTPSLWHLKQAKTKKPQSGPVVQGFCPSFQPLSPAPGLWAVSNIAMGQPRGGGGFDDAHLLSISWDPVQRPLEREANQSPSISGFRTLCSSLVPSCSMPLHRAW